MNNILKIHIFILGLLLVGGCTTSVNSNVTRFHQLAPPGGKTIEVVAIDPTLQQSIEFGTYAQMVGKMLGDAGYVPPQSGRSRLIAEIAYSIMPIGGTVIENRSPVSVGVGVGSGGGRRGGTSMGIGVSTGIGSSNNEPQHVARLTMNIIDLASGTRLYEGHVETIYRSPNLSQMMPFMIDALFKDFPGESGSSNTVKVTPN